MERLPTLANRQPSLISAVNPAMAKGALPYVKHNAIPQHMAQGVGVIGRDWLSFQAIWPSVPDWSPRLFCLVK